jgi:hypothetical protein
MTIYPIFVCVDLRGQNTGWNFALFNTITNSFVEIAGRSAWNTYSDLYDSVKLNWDERIPDWVMALEPEDSAVEVEE